MLINLKYKNTLKGTPKKGARTSYEASKKIKINVKECNLFCMIKGLMFTRREKARALLLFDFKKPKRMKIHSFFCSKFLAVWLDKKNNIIEKRMVYPFNFLILPKQKFSRLVEIPCNSKYKGILKSLDED